MKQKKFFVTILLLSTVVFLLSAYNPPLNGENMYELTSPLLLSGASSVTGGGLNNVGPEHITLNPALLAGEQRWTLNLGYTALMGSEVKDDNGTITQEGGYGQGLQLGIVFPSRFLVASLVAQGVFAEEVNNIQYGNNFAIRGAIAKDITDELYLGLGVNGAFGDDWALNADLGFWYNIKKIKWLPFLKDASWAFSITGMGKAITTDATGAIDSAVASSGYPSPFTPRIGVAGKLISSNNFTTAMSMDASFPTFQNAIVGFGVQFLFFKVIQLQTGWEFNFREYINTDTIPLPTVGLTFRFNFDAGSDNFMAKKGWQQSEMIVSGGYENIDRNINAVSGSATIYLGQKDVEAPVIELWTEETTEQTEQENETTKEEVTNNAE